MGHDHRHHGHSSTKNIKLAFFLNLGFCIIELVGGIFTNSVAILSDALHDLGDSLSLALAWFFQKKSEKQPTKQYTYGYKRFSLLGALINSLVLLVGSVYVITAAVERIISPQQADAKGMFFLALLGITINGIAALRMYKSSSLNERTVSLHLIEDVLGWAAVLIGSIVMIFFDVPILDPILSLLISVYILFNIYRNLRNTFKVVLQGSPTEVEYEEIEEIILDTDGVLSLHDLHIWSMDGEYNVLTVHVVTDEAKTPEQLAELKEEIRDRLESHHVNHCTIETETNGELCTHQCEI